MQSIPSTTCTITDALPVNTPAPTTTAPLPAVSKRKLARQVANTKKILEMTEMEHQINYRYSIRKENILKQRCINYKNINCKRYMYPFYI